MSSICGLAYEVAAAARVEDGVTSAVSDVKGQSVIVEGYASFVTIEVFMVRGAQPSLRTPDRETAFEDAQDAAAWAADQVRVKDREAADEVIAQVVTEVEKALADVEVGEEPAGETTLTRGDLRVVIASEAEAGISWAVWSRGVDGGWDCLTTDGCQVAGTEAIQDASELASFLDPQARA